MKHFTFRKDNTAYRKKIVGFLHLSGKVTIVAAVLGLSVVALSRLSTLLGPTAVSESGAREMGRTAPDPFVPVHSVGEWDQSRGRDFHQAPPLEKAVANGELSPLEERLPEEPLVIHSPESNGPYGGIWHRGALGPRGIEVTTERRMMREGLLRWDAQGEEIVPNLAKGWEVDDEGKVFTFHLREGVRWSDGHPFNAEDIIFWYESVLKNSQLTPSVPRTFRRGDDPVRVEAVDDYTVTFSFSKPYGLFPQLMAAEGHEPVMYPAHYMKQFHPEHASPEEAEREARSRGFSDWSQVFMNELNWSNPRVPRLWAWLLEEGPSYHRARFSRNPYYWKVDPEGNQLPYIDEVRFQVMNEELINMRAIQGALGMQGRSIHFDKLPLLQEKSRVNNFSVRLWRSLESVETVLIPNLRQKDPVLGALLADKNFRRALSLAIDREEIREIAYFGLGTPRQMAPLPQSPFFSEEASTRYTEYDFEEANRLLDSLGLERRNRSGMRLMPDGRVLQLNIESSAQPNPGIHLIVEHWKTVGIDAQLKVQSGPLFWEREGTRLPHILVHGGIDWFIPEYEAGAFYIPYRQWYLTDGQQGEEPLEALRRYMELSLKLEEAVGMDEQIEIHEQLSELRAENIWAIGIVGEIPSIHIVPDSFRNIPTEAAFGWRTRSIGNTAPECFAIVKEDSPEALIFLYPP